ncbi:hypothetical protein VKT23_002333 [Stygiomarasmius scandens]|uniref:Uncharacterized protein n=1 Tax=Marasmiellus scandens TaxID=2682957 RepID=A0ABR1K302_9AGAR
MEPSDPSMSSAPENELNSAPSIDGRRSRPGTMHVAAVFAAVILPITLAPYFLARRRVSMLRKQVSTLENRLQSLNRDIQSMMNESSPVKDEHRRIRGLLHEIMSNAEEHRLQTQESAKSQNIMNQATQSELQRLLEEAQHFRAQGDALRALGPSLADIASFMHEIELFMPLDTVSGEKNRVEQLRLLAFRFQNLPRKSSSLSQAKPQSTTESTDV